MILKNLWNHNMLFQRSQLAETFKHKHLDASLANFTLPDDNMQKILDWIKTEQGIFYFSGNPGIGKTYFCTAICNFFNEKNDISRSFKYMTCMDFLSYVRKKIRDGWDPIETVDYIAKDVFLFCLDDLGENGTETEWQCEILSYFIDLRYRTTLPTVITSNKTTNEIAQVLGNRILSRLKDKNNLLIHLNWIDKRQVEA